MTERQVPQNLNWVEKRAKCTFAVIFKELEAGVKTDLAEMQKNYPADAERFSFSGSGSFFSATRQLDSIMSIIQSVDFSVSRDGIIVKDGQKIWTADIGLNDEGRCLLKVDGKELEQWQFRKMVLLRLFFGPL